MRPYQDAVTDAPTHVDYADVVDLRRALGVSSTDAAATADIQHAIAVASRQIDGYCGREFYRARSTANFVGIPRVITVSRYPLVTVHSVTTTAGGEALPYRPWVQRPPLRRPPRRHWRCSARLYRRVHPPRGARPHPPRRP